MLVAPLAQAIASRHRSRHGAPAPKPLAADPLVGGNFEAG